jgi:ABC-type maltose transport system permease subunit
VEFDGVLQAPARVVGSSADGGRRHAGRGVGKVILRLAASGVFTRAIIVFMGARNEFLLALTFLTSKGKQTATVAISKFT